MTTKQWKIVTVQPTQSIFYYFYRRGVRVEGADSLPYILIEQRVGDIYSCTPQVQDDLLIVSSLFCFLVAHNDCMTLPALLSDLSNLLIFYYFFT